jgi:rhamnose utilization protein RhaD (predicted bifunctional aldolase and dehydrogenase)
MEKREEIVSQLLQVAAKLSAQRMSILGEGNISGLIGKDRFLVKASGISLAHLTAEHLVSVQQKPLLGVIQSGEELTDSDIDELLMRARTDQNSLKPSVETLSHAWLLSLPAVQVVGHCHPVAVNQILCSKRKKDFAFRRLFPDQVVYCGVRSVLIKYVDPGLALARAIANEVARYTDLYGILPKTILLESHGLITIGSHYKEVIAASLMTEKSAEVFIGAAALGGPIFMDEEDVKRIDHRIDEQYRRKISST